MNKKKLAKGRLPKAGDLITFHISNPNWANPLLMKGKVKESSTAFGGHICIETGAVAQEEVLIRLSSVK